MLNQPLIVYDTENGAKPQELQEKLLISGKRKKKLFEIERKESKKLKFSKTTRVNELKPQYNQSRQSKTSASNGNVFTRKLPQNHNYSKNTGTIPR